MQLKSLLEKMIEVHASDAFIIAGLPLACQASGSHVRTDTAPLTPADTQEYIETIYELAGRDLSLFTDSVNHDDDFSLAVPSVGRFRANIFRQRGSYGAVIRVIPFGLPDPDEMNIPESVMRLADLNRGLVLETGPTGCGKSTTLACMLDRMNHKRTGHILTMEDPIEFVHKHGSCIVTQREIPTDIANYSEALRSAMRESPDVILLGEMRDAETIGTAINAAEMAQLVLSTLHTTSAADTIERMIDAFPANQQRQDPHPAVARAAGHGQPDAHPRARRHYHPRVRGHAHEHRHPQPRPRGKNLPDRLRDRLQRRLRHADHGPGAVQRRTRGQSGEGRRAAVLASSGSPPAPFPGGRPVRTPSTAYKIAKTPSCNRRRAFLPRFAT
ncbi:MAG: ATPase, T2SS/T4P/T4SS family [Senegalimassilia faecalis]